MSTEQPPPQSLRKHRQTLITDGKRPDLSQIPGLSGQQQSLPDNFTGLPTVGVKDREKIGKLVKKRLSSRPLQQVYGQDSGAAPALPANAHDLILEVSNNDYPLPPKQRYDFSGGEVIVSDDGKSSAATLPQVSSSALTGPVLSNNNYLQPPPAHSQSRKTSSSSSIHGLQASHDVAERRPSGSPTPVTSERQVFLSPDFDAKTFISNKLSNATDVEISEFADKLSLLQESLAQEKKDEMYSNYQKFLFVGTTISGLSTELETLRKSLNDLNLATTAMKDDAVRHLSSMNRSNPQINRAPSISGNSENGTINNPQQDRRASVIAMEEFWQRNLTSLFRHVEGAQKYLPVIPGRHVIKEQGGWYELNAATWKLLQPAHMFLLNDHLLIATKKRSRDRNTSSGQSTRMLIANQCWPLLDIEVSEVKSYPQIGQKVGQRALSIRFESMIYVYRADKPEHHETFLHEFRKARDELYQLKNSSRRHGPTNSGSSHSRNPSGSSFSGVLSSSPSVPRRPSALTRSDSISLLPSTASSSSKSVLVREVDQTLAELDLKIAHHQFFQVVDLICKSKPRFQEISERFATESSHPPTPNINSSVAIKGRTIVNPSFSPSSIIHFSSDILPIEKLETRISTVTDLLLQRLSEEYLSHKELCQVINMLTQLDASDSAKKSLMLIRHSLIQRRTKQVPFQGDIPGYILQVAFISFQLIFSTVKIYRACYPEQQDSSAIVVWAKSEVDSFSMLFARQLHNVKPSNPIYQECCEIVRKESLCLRQIEIDFSFMLEYMYDATNQKSNK